MTPRQTPTREAVDWSGTVTAMQVRHELLQALLPGDRWLNICPLCSSEPCRCAYEVWEEW